MKPKSLPKEEQRTGGKRSIIQSLFRLEESLAAKQTQGEDWYRGTCSTLRKESGEKAGLSCASWPKRKAAPFPPVHVNVRGQTLTLRTSPW